MVRFLAQLPERERKEAAAFVCGYLVSSMRCDDVQRCDVQSELNGFAEFPLFLRQSAFYPFESLMEGLLV